MQLTQTKKLRVMAGYLNRHDRNIQEHRILLPVLFFALILGLVFLFLLPPWQHYDEPTHFEFAWLIANRSELPVKGEFDQIVRREIAASMVEHKFFEKMDFHPSLIAQGDPVWIGSSQINQRSLYYLLVAAPLYIIRGTDLTYQLYVGRFVSLVLFLITIVAAYGLVSELTRLGNPLRWLVPLTIVLIPGFTDLMTSLNDDVGATAIFSLFLWAGVRTIIHGHNVSRSLGLIVLVIACYWTKNTVAIAVLLAPLPVILAMSKSRRKWISWLFFIGGILLTLTTVLSWGDAANWLRVNYLDSPVRTTEANTPIGEYAFHLPLTPGSTPSSLTQVLTDSQIKQVQGKTVTVGAWIWASKPVTVRTPIIYYDSEMIYEQVEIDEEPSYYQFSIKIPDNPKRLQVMISPSRSRVNEEISIYYDGLVLVEGDLYEAPEFDGIRGSQLLVEQKPVNNLLRNASAELSWPYVHVWADNIIRDFFPGRTSLILAATLDWSQPLWYYKATFRQLFTSFWARFGWGHVTLIGFHPYLFLGLFSVVGVIAGVYGLGKRAHFLTWEIMIFFGASLATIWGAAFMRGIGSIISGPVFIPSARYAYPVIIPTVMLLTVGWREAINGAGKILSLSSKMRHFLYLLILIGITLQSLYSIIDFYYP